MRVLAIGAHYDDIEIGCGGTILKHIENGDDVYFAITSSDEYRTGNVLDRLKEQQKSAEIMGIGMEKIFSFSYSDEMHENIGELDKLKPDIIFTHYEFDTHQDHRRASLIGQAVGRKRNTTLMFYDSGSSYEFYPTIFSRIDYDKKLELLNCFKSQILSGCFQIDISKKKNIYWASIITDDMTAYAEAFVSRKMIYTV